MGRVEFTKDIKCHKPFDDAVLEYFDEIMVLYDLVYEYKDLDISTTDDDGMRFTIVFSSADSIKDIVSLIHGRTIYKFSKIFESVAQHKGNEIYVEILSKEG